MKRFRTKLILALAFALLATLIVNYLPEAPIPILFNIAFGFTALVLMAWIILELLK